MTDQTDEITTEEVTEVAKPQAPVVFFCRDCQKVVDEPVKRGNKYEYTCPVCKGDRVAFGTRQAVSDFFQVNLSKKA